MAHKTAIAHKTMINDNIMSRVKPSQPRVLVTDAGRGSAVSIIRCLGQRGWTVIAADSDPQNPGFHSRFASETLLYPKPEAAPQEFVAALLHNLSAREVDLVIPVTDNVILPILTERAQLEEKSLLALPETDALLVTMDKCKTLQMAQHLGIPIPTTRQVQTVEEARREESAFSWPIVVKPQLSRFYQGRVGITSFKVSYATNVDELTTQVGQYEGLCPVLLQEYYSGIGYGVELLMYKGQPLAAFQHKRLREVPLTGGVSTFRESVALDPLLYRYAVQLLGQLEWTGLAMVEFKVGQDGPRLMEINGRVWGSLPLAVHSGMNFPVRLAELYLYDPPLPNIEPSTDYTTGVRARNLELDIGWMLAVLYGKQRYPFFSMPSRSKAGMAFLELFNPKYRFDILALNDPLPGLIEIAKIAKKLYRKTHQELA